MICRTRSMTDYDSSSVDFIWLSKLADCLLDSKYEADEEKNVNVL
jgi:hypothetical protein